jgi:hypothetical protein
MKKKEAQKKLQEVDEFIRKETTDNNIPIESGDWIDNLKKGDRIYSAGFEKDAEGKETVKVLTLQFEEYDKQSIATPNVRMAKLLPIIDDKIPENVNLPSQNIRVGFFKTPLEAVRAFEERMSHIANVIKETGDRMEAEANKKVVNVPRENKEEN